MEMIRIKRRTNRGAKEIVESVQLIKKNPKSVIVRLINGDVIKRKIKDVVVSDV